MRTYDHLRESLNLTEAEKAPSVVKAHFKEIEKVAKAAAASTDKQSAYKYTGKVVELLSMISKKIDSPLYEPLKRLAGRWEEL